MSASPWVSLRLFACNNYRTAERNIMTFYIRSSARNMLVYRTGTSICFWFLNRHLPVRTICIYLFPIFLTANIVAKPTCVSALRSDWMGDSLHCESQARQATTQPHWGIPVVTWSPNSTFRPRKVRWFTTTLMSLVQRSKVMFWRGRYEYNYAIYARSCTHWRSRGSNRVNTPELLCCTYIS